MLFPLLIATATGLVAGLGWWWAYRPAALFVGRRVLRPARKRPGKRWLRGTQFVLSGQLPLAIWIGLSLPAPIVHFGLSLFLPGWAAVLGAGFALSAIIAEVATNTRQRYAIERTLLPVAVDNLLAHASVDYTTRVLEYTLHSPDPVFRLAAVKGLSALGTQQALRLLAKSANDPDVEVRMASERGSESIRRALGDGKPLSVIAMPTLFKEHTYWSDRLDHLTGHEFKSAARKLIELEHTMTEMVNTQVGLRNAFPALWCAKCNARSAEGRYARWRYVHCRRCHDVTDMRPEVRSVTGRIGHSADKPLDKRDIVIPLWDPAQQTAQFAEIDILEIHDAPGLNADWAVNAVVGRLLDQWPDRQQVIEVRIFGKPALSPNAIRLLQQLDPEFQPAG